MKHAIVKALARWLPLTFFGSSRAYWQRRYRLGGDSGAGSTGIAATYKARVLNDFVGLNGVGSVIEFGCGDGRQLELAKYPSYLGLDISADAVALCQERFRNDLTKNFGLLRSASGHSADLALSLDVIYHLVEDDTYVQHLQGIFRAARRFVAIYSSDVAGHVSTLRHVRHRSVSTDIAERFPEFERMLEAEASLPEPVETNRGVSTVFLLYRRRKPV